MRLSAQTLRHRIMRDIIIVPFHEKTIVEGRSFGLSSAGYDVRIAQTIWLWPGWGRLASTMEHIAVPNDLTVEVKDKSTNARKFIRVANTFIDPGFRGFITLELTRHLPWPIRIKKGTPIAQYVFDQLDQPTSHPYRGKYQNQQAGPVPAILEKSDGSLSGTSRLQSGTLKSKPTPDRN